MGTIEVAVAKSTNPATGEDVAAYPYLDERGVAGIVQTAAEGFAVWRDTTPAARAGVFRRLAELLRRDTAKPDSTHRLSGSGALSVVVGWASVS